MAVTANVGSVLEAETAVRAGAAGVGLVRTELLFLGRSRAAIGRRAAQPLRADPRGDGGPTGGVPDPRCRRRQARRVAGRSCRGQPGARCPWRPPGSRPAGLLDDQLRALVEAAAGGRGPDHAAHGDHGRRGGRGAGAARCDPRVGGRHGAIGAARGHDRGAGGRLRRRRARRGRRLLQHRHERPRPVHPRRGSDQPGPRRARDTDAAGGPAAHRRGRERRRARVGVTWPSAARRPPIPR